MSLTFVSGLVCLLKIEDNLLHLALGASVYVFSKQFMHFSLLIISRVYHCVTNVFKLSW